MMIVRKSEERRQIISDDQKTWMTFDPENKALPLWDGFGVLKTLNEEILSPGGGFTLQTPADMIIVTYIQEGVIVYKGPLEKPDELQRSEFHQVKVVAETKQYGFNVSKSDDAHVFQCVFIIDECGPNAQTNHLKLAEAKKLFTLAERKGKLRLIASPDGKEASLKIQQDVQIYSTLIHKGNHIIHELKPDRSAWLHVVKGRILINGIILKTGDGVGCSEERSVSFTAQEPSEILLFDLCGQVPGEIKTGPQVKLEPAEIR
jgi:redox-sensitive bicupin YhaK (pirin superfamily)